MRIRLARAALDRHLEAADAAQEPGGMFWISYLKGSWVSG
jgi:hypothetical protein